MPIVPYLQNGLGQVPLQGFVPSTSTRSSASYILPTFPPVRVDSQPDPAPDASHADLRPTIDVPIDLSYKQASGSSVASSVERPSKDTSTSMKGKKPAIATASTLLSLFSFSQIYQNLVLPRITPESERAEERSWAASSQSWVDRKACNWFGLCGLAHLNKSGWTSERLGKFHKSEKTLPDGQKHDGINLTEFWESASNVHPDQWSAEERILREIPDYVIQHAPYIYLYSGEEFWPCDIAEHLIHTTPHLNYTPLQAASDHPNLTNLDDLNRWGRFVYLQSDDNVEDRPKWLGGETNIPTVPDDSESDPETEWEEEDANLGGGFREDVDGKKADWWEVGIGDTKDKGGIRPVTTAPGAVPTNIAEGDELVREDEEVWQSELSRRRRGRKVVGGRSDAPAVLIVVEKDDGVVDAFWFFFYSYNLGNTVFNVRFGNHVGDWEHTAIRFQHGKPKAVFFSEHNFGGSYTWDAVEKMGERPVGFSATGTHAMYATAGLHPYVLPGGILHDVTDRGPLWDPTLNLMSFTYDYRLDILRSSNLTPKAPIGWFYFFGHWGDKFYPLSDPRQYQFVGQYHYVNGPLGPRFKNLGRKHICGGNDDCELRRTRRVPNRPRRLKRFQGVGEGEEMSEEDVRRFVGPREKWDI